MPRAEFIDFRERAPRDTSAGMWKRDSSGAVVNRENIIGAKSVAVPGEVAGLAALLERHGTITLAEVLEPSIRPAEDGASAFYSGEIAHAVVSTVRKHGGVLSRRDLADYRVEFKAPAEGSYRGYSIISSPPPSSGGSHIIQALNILSCFDPWTFEHRDTTHYSVGDREGSLIAVTKTINHFFGSALTVEGTGILLNNSMADFSVNRGHVNAVEPGKKPLSTMAPTILLKDGMPFNSRVYHLKTIHKGEGVSCSYRWRAKRDTRIATIPAGCCDGYPRNMSMKGQVTIRGRRAPVIGVVCMDQFMADVTEIPGVRAGDEVVLFGDPANQSLTVDEVAVIGETNKNEIISRITRRVPRVYLENNRTVSMVNHLE